MKLLLDQGNSRLKWALVGDRDKFVARGGIDQDAPLGEVADLLLDLARDHTIETAAISAVSSSERRQALVEAVANSLGINPRTMEPRASCAGLKSGYADPSRLGVDRWLAMLGARALGGGAWLVVDAGTAMTVDAVSAGGLHLGGYIVPGYRMQISMLGSKTARIGNVVPAVGSGWGRETASAVANGVALELAALVDRALVELAGGGDDTCRLIVTGGDAELLAPLLRTASEVDPDLVFRGMLVELSDPSPRK